MPTLFGPNGHPLISSADHKRDNAPPEGPAFGRWSGRDVQYAGFPGGNALLQFDLDALTMSDFRAMKEHPTINSSLSVLTFMLHQVDWHIECENQKIADMVEANMRSIWTRLVRAMSTAFWSGYSPNILEYENNSVTGYTEITKVKDLVPEECEVHWKEVVGSYAPPGKMKPKFEIYDGIDQWGAPFPVPSQNTFWYPLLMENGNYYGRKLLKPAFMPWYFSLLIHLFSNRYFERFGEPTIYGRAPFDEDITTTNSLGEQVTKSGRQVMEDILTGLRNRSVVVLPSERDPSGAQSYTWDISYLESQMRGADFERYMGRLDEEMSMALFTPLLLLRTGGGDGSFNLGVQHTQTWLWMLNALTGDMAEYINRYVCDRLKAINFTPNAPECKWVPKKMGRESVETLRAVITALVTANKVKPDVEELGQALGMTLTEIQEVTADTSADETGDEAESPVDNRPRTERDRSAGGPRGVGEPRATGRQISNRIRGQVEKAFRDGKFDKDFKPSMGFKRRMEQSLQSEGLSSELAIRVATDLYGRMERWMETTVELGPDEFAGPSDYMALFDRRLDLEIESLRG